MPKACCVRVVRVPSGDAPEKIRLEWIGLTIPLLFEEPVEAPTFGPATGKPTGVRTGWVVPAVIAIDLLHRQSPGAADWWRDLKSWGFDDVLMFGLEECEYVEVEEDDVRQWVIDALTIVAVRESVGCADPS